MMKTTTFPSKHISLSTTSSNATGSFNLSSSNLTISNNLTINAKEFNIIDKANTFSYKEDKQKYHDNYTSVAVKAFIEGMVAGFFSQDSVLGKTGLNPGGVAGKASNADYLAGKIGYLDTLNDIMKAASFDILGAVKTPIGGLTGAATDYTIDKNMGFEGINDKFDVGSTEGVIGSEKVESEVKVGGKVNVNLKK